jgi:hypothetical protein
MNFFLNMGFFFNMLKLGFNTCGSKTFIAAVQLASAMNNID